MKFFLTTVLVFLCVIFCSYNASSQGIQGAVAFGGNLTQIDGDEVYGFKKIGFNAAAIAIIPIKEKWGVSIEASFAQKGAFQNILTKIIPTNHYHIIILD